MNTNTRTTVSGNEDKVIEPQATRRSFVTAGLTFAAGGLIVGEASARTATVPVSRGADIVASSANCLTKGELCLSHCVRITQTGDATLAECMRSVSVMLTVCSSMMRLAALESPMLADMAKIARKTCEACRVECKKHAMHHTECNACMEACAETLKTLSNSSLLK